MTGNSLTLEAMPRGARSKEATVLAKSFGQRLRALREERSLSQRELAQGIGTETAQISRYERGVVMPNAESLVGLAQYLKVGVGYLLAGDAGGAPPPDIPIPDLSLLERFRDLQKLARKDREVIIAVIDAMLSSREYEEVGTKRARRSA